MSECIKTLVIKVYENGIVKNWSYDGDYKVLSKPAPEVREVERRAEVGELVRLKEGGNTRYKPGDIVICAPGCCMGHFEIGSTMWDDPEKYYTVLENYAAAAELEPEPAPEPPRFTFEGFRAGKIAVKVPGIVSRDMFMSYLQGAGIKWADGSSAMGYKTDSTVIRTRNGALAGSSAEYCGEAGIPVIPFSRDMLTESA